MTLKHIYDRHADFVWRMLRRQGVADQDLADATQEVFLAVHRNLSRFQNRSSLTTWLFTVCRSVARDHRRRVYHRYEVQEPGKLEGEIDLRADVQGAAESSERRLLLESILGELPPDQRNVFVLFEIEEMTGEEISQMLAAPLGTVYSRLALARKAFRQALARRQPIEQPRAPALRAGGRS
jgi:RNA polymerase sigma-70 factor (ECF subfamily)